VSRRIGTCKCAAAGQAQACDEEAEAVLKEMQKRLHPRAEPLTSWVLFTPAPHAQLERLTDELVLRMMISSAHENEFPQALFRHLRRLMAPVCKWAAVMMKTAIDDGLVRFPPYALGENVFPARGAGEITDPTSRFVGYDFELKIVLAGAPTSGKTSILDKYSRDIYTENHLPTKACNVSKIPVLVNIGGSGRLCQVHAWDTASGINAPHWRGAAAAMICVDLTCVDFASRPRSTYTYGKQSLPDIIQECYMYAPEEGFGGVVIVGTKADVPNRNCSLAVMQSFCRKHRVPYFECSSKTGKGIEAAFHAVIELAAKSINSNLMHHHGAAVGF